MTSSFEVNIASLALLALVLLVAALYLRAAAAAEPDAHPILLARQASVSRVRASSEETAVYRHRLAPHQSPVYAGPPEVRTLYDTFVHGLRNGKKAYLGHRPTPSAPYVWESYEEVNERVTNFGSGVLSLTNLLPGQFPKNLLGILMKNSPNWLVADLACAFYSLCACPLYDTSSRETLKLVLNRTRLTTLVATRTCLTTVLEAKPDVPSLITVILADGDAGPDQRDKARKMGMEVVTFRDVERLGKENRRSHVPPKPQEIATMCWISGTTDDPKGAMVSHRNVVAAFSSVLKHVPPSAKLTNSVVHISYLPLVHNFEHVICYAITYLGGMIGFSVGDSRLLFDDAKALKPTVFISVPHVLKSFHKQVVQSVHADGGFKTRAFWRAYRLKREALRRGRLVRDGFWDHYVFVASRRELGGRVDLVINESELVGSELLEFWRIVLGCQVLEGYGQTESTGVATLVSFFDYVSPWGTHVGPPLPCNEIKLRDISEMGYRSSDEPNPRGEVLIRGYNVFSGYFGDAETTKEVLGLDGWLATGDVGELLPNGTLKIIDRKEAIFKLSQGEFVAPAKLERVLTSSPYISQAFVYGDPHRSALVAVIVPDEEAVESGRSLYGASGSLADLCRTEAVYKLVNAELQRVSAAAGLAGYECPQAVHLCSEPFSVANGLLTPTLKLRREVLRERFWKTIEGMYRNL